MVIVMAMVITLTRETAVKNKDSNLLDCDTLSLGDSKSVYEGLQCVLQRNTHYFPTWMFFFLDLSTLKMETQQSFKMPVTTHPLIECYIAEGWYLQEQSC